MSWVWGIYCDSPFEGGRRQRQLACWSHSESPLLRMPRPCDGQFSMTMSLLPGWAGALPFPRGKYPSPSLQASVFITAWLRLAGVFVPLRPDPAPAGTARTGCSGQRAGGFRMSPRRRPLDLSGQPVHPHSRAA